MYNDPQREVTQNMLNKIHELKKNPIKLNENSEQKIELDQDNTKEEEKKFRNVVSPRVEFNRMFVYPNASNVEWSGKFTDTNVEWVYSLDDATGVYISGDLVRLSESMMETLKKLTGYYATWSSEWANKVAEDYKTNNQ
jgi:hypothetical protein